MGGASNDRDRFARRDRLAIAGDNLKRQIRSKSRERQFCNLDAANNSFLATNKSSRRRRGNGNYTLRRAVDSVFE